MFQTWVCCNSFKDGGTQHSHLVIYPCPRYCVCVWAICFPSWEGSRKPSVTSETSCGPAEPARFLGGSHSPGTITKRRESRHDHFPDRHKLHRIVCVSDSRRIKGYSSSNSEDLRAAEIGHNNRHRHPLTDMLSLVLGESSVVIFDPRKRQYNISLRTHLFHLRHVPGAMHFTTGNVEMWPPPNCEVLGVPRVVRSGCGSIRAIRIHRPRVIDSDVEEARFPPHGIIRMIPSGFLMFI